MDGFMRLPEEGGAERRGLGKILRAPLVEYAR